MNIADIFYRIVGGIVVILMYGFIFSYRPKKNKRISPPRFSLVIFRSLGMKKFLVTVKWVPSTEETVVSQKLSLTVNGVDLAPVNLSPSVSKFSFKTAEKAKVKGSIVASNGPHSSASLPFSFDVPAFVDLIIPASPAGLTFDFAIVDEPEPSTDSTKTLPTNPFASK